MDKISGGLSGVPLDMAGEAGMIIVDRQTENVDPFTGFALHLSTRVVIV